MVPASVRDALERPFLCMTSCCRELQVLHDRHLLIAGDAERQRRFDCCFWLTSASHLVAEYGPSRARLHR